MKKIIFNIGLFAGHNFHGIDLIVQKISGFFKNHTPVIFQTSLSGVPNAESPFFKRIFSDGNFDEATRKVAFELAVQGFAITDFPDNEFPNFSKNIKPRLHRHFDFDEWRREWHKNGISLRIQMPGNSTLCTPHCLQ